MSISDHILNKEHEKILEYNGEQYEYHKIIALIYLERHEEALKYIKSNTFEQAYIYYELKNYKKALKICCKLIKNNANISNSILILKSQCLFHLGYFATAYEILVTMPFNDELVINLYIMFSLSASFYNSKFAKLYTIPCKNSKKEIIRIFGKEIIENNKLPEILQKYEFENKKLKDEAVYNYSFRFSNEKEYINYLEANKNILEISNQLKNVIGEFEQIDENLLNKKNKKILMKNKNCDNLEQKIIDEKEIRSEFVSNYYYYDSLNKRNTNGLMFKDEQMNDFAYYRLFLQEKLAKNKVENVKDENIKKILEFLKSEDGDDRVKMWDELQEIIKSLNC